MRKYTAILGVALILLAAAPVAEAADRQASFSQTFSAAQRKVVKIFGAGGAQRLEGYQSGLLVSPQGHVLTVWSYVLDVEATAVVLSDGRRFEAELIGADPRTGIAVLLIPYEGEPLPHFQVAESVTVDIGDRVLALSNLYRIASGNEPVSVQRGLVSAVAPLEARRGAVPVQFSGDVLLLDAITNNPGAAGGAIIDLEGRLAGMIGRELRSSTTNAWLNYALPVEVFKESFDAILAGRFVAPSIEGDATLRPEKPWSFGELGIVLVPDVVANTPPFIDAVRPQTPAAGVDLQPDDLLVLIDDQLVPSCRAARAAVSKREKFEPLRVTVLRDGELIEFTLSDTSSQSGE